MMTLYTLLCIIIASMTGAIDGILEGWAFDGRRAFERKYGAKPYSYFGSLSWRNVYIDGDPTQGFKSRWHEWLGAFDFYHHADDARKIGYLVTGLLCAVVGAKGAGNVGAPAWVSVLLLFVILFATSAFTKRVGMKWVRSIAALMLLPFLCVSQNTRIDPTALIRPSGTNSTMLITNGSGQIVWGNAAAILSAGSGISITGNTISATAGLGGSGTAGQVAYFSAANTVTSNLNLHWDNTNARLGVGISPAFKLDVFGSVRFNGGLASVNTADVIYANNILGTVGLQDAAKATRVLFAPDNGNGYYSTVIAPQSATALSWATYDGTAFLAAMRTNGTYYGKGMLLAPTTNTPTAGYILEAEGDVRFYGAGGTHFEWSRTNNGLGIRGAANSTFGVYSYAPIRADGAIMSVGTGAAPNLTASAVRLWNTGGTGDMWQVSSSDAGDLVFRSNNLAANILQLTPLGVTKTIGKLEVGALGSTPTSIFGRNAAGEMCQIAVSTGLTLSGGILTASGGGGGGVTTVGPINNTATANGASITGSTLNLHRANDFEPGVVSSSTDVGIAAGIMQVDGMSGISRTSLLQGQVYTKSATVNAMAAGYAEDNARIISHSEDFIAPTLAVNFYGTTVANTGANNLGSTTNIGEAGVLIATTGTNAAGRATYRSGEHITFGQGDAIFDTRNVRIATALSNGTETYQYVAGFHDGTTAANILDGCYFLYDNTNANWRCVTVNNGVSTGTVTATTVAVALNTPYDLKVVIRNTGTLSAVYSINGTTVATHTTNIPSAAGTYTCAGQSLFKTLGATARTVSTDLITTHLVIPR